MRLQDLFETVDYDLQKKYDYFNELLFGGKLPKVPLSWKKLKKVGGQVVFNTMLEPGRIPPQPVPARYRRFVQRDPAKEGYRVNWPTVRLEISNLWQRPEAGNDGILVHEMIHVWMLVQGNIAEMHGREFMGKLHELQSKVTFDIPVTEKSANLELTDPTVKRIGVLLMQKKDGQYVYAIMTEKAAREGLDDIQKRFSSYVEGSYGYANSAKLLIVGSEAWTKKAMTATLQRKVTRDLKMFYMKPELAETLLKDLEGAEVLWEARREA